ncbi:hypothetical protein LDO32_04640 [Luteimonas sp. Y-2-2-4F]|nr:hypothetical protein [Luteimonas sp. Y-2-2-4F]MCD9031016.1 hypothetical protein [Luteimonas sp. Y-2-2-4F]
MRIGWALAVLVWVVPLGSLLACPHDLHGFSTCSSAAQIGRTLSSYLVAPGVWFGSVVSGALSSDPYAGASLPAYLFGVLSWLALLSGAIILLCTRLSAHKSSAPSHPKADDAPRR